MNSRIEFASSPASTRQPPSGITIIYEDRVTGLRAKHFSDMLSASLGDSQPSDPACWRLELIDLPGLADEIHDDAADSEFVILSLRGDTHLSCATKQWLETWLESAASGPASLIALFDPVRSAAPHAEATRCYLRHMAAKLRVAFFAHSATTPGPSDHEFVTDDEEPALRLRPRRQRRKIAASAFPAAISATFLPATLAL